MRTLASIQSVNDVKPIPGADAIEAIRVLGWWVVVKKNDYKVGDRLIYCEIDSLLPERPEFEFLRAMCYKPARPDPADPDNPAAGSPAGYRIKTLKLRGQVSQGICFPLSLLPGGADFAGFATTGLTDGCDVTDVLGVRKWEPPAPVGMSGRVKGDFPGFLSKTDETRVQLLEDVLLRHKGKSFAVTEKLDGTSFTAFLRDGVYGICGRNWWLDETDLSNALARLAAGVGLEEKLRLAKEHLGFDVCVQGEVVGPGIQKNKYGLDEIRLYVFNVVNVETKRLLGHAASLDVLDKIGLRCVPQLGLTPLDHTVDQLVAMAEGTSVLSHKTQREGIVLRPIVDEDDETLGGRLSFKVINPKFLLKYDE